MSARKRGAFIDVGSNSVRLMVVEWEAHGRWRIVDEERAILRLGGTLASDGVLAGEEPRAEAVLRTLVDRARQLGASRIEAVGTAAMRAAPDGDAFATMLARGVGIGIRILDGAEEARLGFLGALNTLDTAGGNLVDIGGASTEISGFSGRRLRSAASAPVGAVTLSRGLEGDPPGREALESIRAAALAALKDAMPQPRRGVPLVAIGGSFRSIAKIHKARVSYPLATLHNYTMPPAAISELASEVERLPVRERAKVPGLAAHRAEIMPAALEIARAAVEWLEPTEIRVSGAGLREGLLFEAILPRGSEVLADVFGPSVENLRFQMGEGPQEQDLMVLAEGLFAALSPLFGEPGSLELARAAASLRGIGGRINVYDRHPLTFVVVLGARLFGLSHRIQIVLAAAASYEGPKHVRAHLAPYASLLAPGDQKLALRLGLTVAYADALSRQFPGARPRISAGITPSLIDLRLQGVAPPPALPFREASRLEAQFPKVFGRKIACRYI